MPFYNFQVQTEKVANSRVTLLKVPSFLTIYSAAQQMPFQTIILLQKEMSRNFYAKAAESKSNI